MRAQEFLVEMNRRGFLKGLAVFAASAAVPSSVVKLLSTPAGVSSLATSAGVSALGIEAGLALLKGIRQHLDQYRAEDDDDYFEAYEDMAAKLGFDATNADGEYIDPLSDLLNLYRKNPEQSAQQLIKHVQSKAVDPAKVKASFQPRDDWRYHARKNREEPELTGGYGDKPEASAKPAVTNVATAPGTLARAATVAKAGIDKLSNLGKNMSLRQQVKATPALSAPTRPEVELPVNAKQKQKVGQEVAEATTVERDGLTLEYQFSANQQKLKITALSNGRRLGSADFQNYGPVDQPQFKGDQVDVDERYRGQGIATVMYDLARELVGQIYPSPSQTQDGQAFWKDKPVWEDSVEENRNTIIDKGIGQALRDKGYKKIGHGVDQDAYIEPGTGQVLKIFGTGRWNKSGFSDDHKMFFKWYKYCMKHADNPYLPKFSGYETFEFKGKTYLQIRQERLTRDTKFASELAAYGRPFIGDSSPSNTVPPELVMTVLKSMVEKGGYKMKGWSDYENRGFTPGVAGGFERIIQRLGIDGFYKWIITCKELRHTARMNWWHYDLESWNIMMRGQTPVILDPWYAGSTIE